MVSYASQHRTFFYNLKRYGLKLSKEEIKQILITVLIVAFVYSFNKWGDIEFDFVSGITNFGIGALFALIGIFLNQIGQRIVAVYYGYDPIYEYGILGLMISLVLAFASRGYLFFFLPGGINLRFLSASRLGEFRYYTNDWEWAKAGFMGPFLNIMAAVLASPFKNNPLVLQFMIVNIAFAFYSFIPLPGNLGLYLFYPHIYFWTFALGIVIACSAMAFFLKPIITIVLGLLFGIFAMYWHYVKLDNQL